MMGIDKPMNHDGWLQRIGASRFLDPALGLHPLSQRPHVVFYNLHNAGGSAIVPILEEWLQQKGYANLVSPAETFRFHAELEKHESIFHWTHDPLETFTNELERDDFRFICLTRDPRDVMISNLKDVTHQGNNKGNSILQLCHNSIQSGFNQWFDQAHAWRALKQSNVMQISFEEMKQNIPALMECLSDFIGIPVDPKTIGELCKKYSFENVAGRQRGEAGETIRNKFMLRKGIRGDWANHFDGPTARQFHCRFGRYLRAWGYEPNGLWTKKHALEQKPKGNG